MMIRIQYRRTAAVLLASLLLGWTANAVAQAWSHKNIHARYGHSAVFDAATNKMIIFGGQHALSFPNEFDVWWAEYTPGSSELHMVNLKPVGVHPPARYGHTAVYDSATATMMMFGGGQGTAGTPAPCLNDYYLLDFANGAAGNSAWINENTTGTKP